MRFLVLSFARVTALDDHTVVIILTRNKKIPNLDVYMNMVPRSSIIVSGKREARLLTNSALLTVRKSAGHPLKIGKLLTRTVV